MIFTYQSTEKQQGSKICNGNKIPVCLAEK